MKKTILILLASLFIGCDKEETDCDCNGKYQLFTYPEQHYYKKTIIDCTTKKPTYDQSQSNSVFIKCE